MTLSRPVKVLIVEDSPVIRKDTETVLKLQKEFSVVGSCRTVKQAKDTIPVTKPDLLLLDIELPDGTAFDILQQKFDSPFKVIFLTAYEQHAVKAIRFGALDYLLKPASETELREALKKALLSYPIKPEQITIAHEQYQQKGATGRIVLSSKEYLQVVQLKDIMYCRSLDGYTTFYLADERKILTSKTIREYEDTLPEDKFIRPHQSYIVNFDFVDRYQKQGESNLILKNGVVIPVSLRKREQVINFFKTFNA